MVVCLLIIGWTREITSLLTGTHEGDTVSILHGPAIQVPTDVCVLQFKHLSIGIAIASIYFLDFSINCGNYQSSFWLLFESKLILLWPVQASCRALLVDALPPSQQEDGTAWASRMVGLGNVAGYFM